MALHYKRRRKGGVSHRIDGFYELTDDGRYSYVEGYTVQQSCGFAGCGSYKFAKTGNRALDRLLENITGTYWSNW